MPHIYSLRSYYNFILFFTSKKDEKKRRHPDEQWCLDNVA